MITELTKEQKELLPVYEKRSMDIGLCTDQMTEDDRKRVSELMLKVYDASTGVNSMIAPDLPIIRLFVKSPLSACKLIATIDKNPNVLQGYTGLESNDEFVENVLSQNEGEVASDSPFFSGNHETYWLQYGNYMNTELGVEFSQKENFDILLELSKLCGWIYTRKYYAVVCERPSEVNLENGVIHNENGPAIAYTDGYKLHALNGHVVPDYVIERPEEITVEKIKEERKKNVETARIMMEVYGVQKYISEMGGEVLDVDSVGLSGESKRILVEDDEKQRWLIASDGSTGRIYTMPVEDVSTCVEAHSQIAGFDADTKIKFES